jgi:hypothetical protein
MIFPKIIYGVQDLAKKILLECLKIPIKWWIKNVEYVVGWMDEGGRKMHSHWPEGKRQKWLAAARVSKKRVKKLKRERETEWEIFLTGKQNEKCLNGFMVLGAYNLIMGLCYIGPKTHSIELFRPIFYFRTKSMHSMPLN